MLLIEPQSKALSRWSALGPSSMTTVQTTRIWSSLQALREQRRTYAGELRTRPLSATSSLSVEIGPP